MQVRFWGTRGSVPTPGPATVRYGGNTSCIEVRSARSLAIFDCGTGARGLGASLAAEGGGLRAHLFLSHVHWDHIQGFPFFLPAFLPNAELEVYGVAGMESGLEESLSGQMQYTYFPVRLTDLRSRMDFHEVGEDSFRAGDFAVHTAYLNHTCPAVGYRVELGGSSVVYLSDHEPYWPHNPEAGVDGLLHHPADRRHVAFAEGADLLIHDAQYLFEEYPARRGWGHSTVEYVVDVAAAARVKRLALFHHDPARTDLAIDEMVERAQNIARARGADLEVFAAAEGQTADVRGTGQPDHELLPLLTSSSAPPARLLLLGSEMRRRQLREALGPDSYRLNEAELAEQARDWAVLDPDLICVAAPAGEDPVALLKSVGEMLPNRPIVAVLEELNDQLTLRHLGEIAADVIGAPFGGPNLRARVRACLSRRQVPAGHVAKVMSAAERLDVLDVLPPDELSTMVQGAAICGFRPGEVLFHEGDQSLGVYFIRRGVARVFVATPEGGEVLVGYAGPGEIIGEMSAIDGAPRSATVVAQEPLEASYIARDAFRGAIRKTPEAAMRMLELLVRRLRAVDARVAQTQGSNGAPSPEADPFVDLDQSLAAGLVVRDWPRQEAQSSTP